MLHRPFILAAALLGGAWYVVYRYVRQQRDTVNPRAQPEYLETWEGEGGGVPVGGSRTAAQVQPEDPIAASNPMAERFANRLEGPNPGATGRAS